ncbi:MAG: hypothetical protein JXA57_01775 [Armatimonadetes bacterium]|nr:hypothetical protein [Armatimonadota bacterium]
MTQALFLRLLASQDKGADLASALAAVRRGQADTRVFQVDPESFRQIPGAPFAYWVSDRVRRLFKELPPFEGDGRTVRVGLQTGDDFRFVRAWWEVAPERILDAQHGPDWRKDLPAFQAWCRQRTHEGKRWVPFAKGGEYSPYYADIHLVVNWEWEGKEIKEFVDPETGKTYSRPQNTDFYFRPGLTWPRRTQGGFNLRVHPSGSAFADKGPVAFGEPRQLQFCLGLMNSQIFKALIAAQMAFGSYEVGVIQRTPVARWSGDEGQNLGYVALLATDRKRYSDIANEASHLFAVPLGCAAGQSLGDVFKVVSEEGARRDTDLADFRSQIDQSVAALYGLTSADFGPHNGQPSPGVTEAGDLGEEVEEDEAPPVTSPSALASSLVSYLLGCVFGRWDARLATGERPLPDLPDPFDPLPVCSLGMLQGDDGLALRSTPEGYPLSIDWDGILVDDPGHPDDLLARIRQMLELIYKERAGAIEAELAELLGVKDLRDYFRRPTKGGFWLDHLARYSKSRRKAPIYWLLQSKKRNYALWLYYHRLDRDLLYKALVNYVEPKLRLEESRRKELEQARILAGPTGREAKQLARETEAQEELVQELAEFARALSRAAELHLIPDLDDGVLLNIASLWELVPWKEAATSWEELLKGKYPWSSIGEQLKERGVVGS